MENKEQLEKLLNTRADLRRILCAAVSSLDTSVNGAPIAEFENILKAVNFYFGKVREIDFSISCLNLESANVSD